MWIFKKSGHLYLQCAILKMCKSHYKIQIIEIECIKLFYISIVDWKISVIGWTHGTTNNINIWIFIPYDFIYETSCKFYIPQPLARGYWTHNKFHNTAYGMKIHLRFFLSHELTWNEQITTWSKFLPQIGQDYNKTWFLFVWELV